MNSPRSVHSSCAPSVLPPADVWTWLLRLRWGACLGQAGAVATVRWLLGVPVPAVELLGLIALAACSNLLLARRLARGAMPSFWAMTALFVFDVSVCTIALGACGGVHNPFIGITMVHVALAATVLPMPHLGVVLAAAVACMTALFLGPLPDAARYGLHSSPLYLRGMAVSYGVAAGFIAVFVARMQQALARSENELARARERATRDERLSSLATLAAGAAHELASPLGTIAVAAGEMERRLRFFESAAGEKADPAAVVHIGCAELASLRADAGLVRQEVRRCRDVLRQVVEDSEATAADTTVSVPPDELVREAVSGLSGASRVRLHLAPEAPALSVPRRSVVHGLRAVVHNALQSGASGSEQEAGEVAVRVSRHRDQLHISVADAGRGMDTAVLARAGEPFFTTKRQDGGSGLGLFLARTIFERLGGGLDVASRPGSGTTVVMQLPLPVADGS